MILGITGTFAAGKDTVAEYLKMKGFGVFSLSDALRDEATARGLSHDRDTLRELGNELRRTGSNAVLAERVLAKMASGGVQNAAVVSIRHPKEVEELRKHPGFHLIAVDAPQKLRYERLAARSRDGDAPDFATFQKQEAAEMSGADPAQQQIRAVVAMAEQTIGNEGSFADLYAKVDQFLADVQK